MIGFLAFICICLAIMNFLEENYGMALLFTIIAFVL